jgi:hypothetical protein
MPHHTQAEIFIKTLAEMRDEECERQAARLRLQHKAQASRFMKAFWTEIDDSLRPSELTLQGTPAGYSRS